MFVQSCNSNTCEADVEGLEILNQLGVHGEILSQESKNWIHVTYIKFLKVQPLCNAYHMPVIWAFLTKIICNFYIFSL